jgi:hypothetical protein
MIVYHWQHRLYGALAFGGLLTAIPGRGHLWLDEKKTNLIDTTIVVAVVMHEAVGGGGGGSWLERMVMMVPRRGFR